MNRGVVVVLSLGLCLAISACDRPSPASAPITPNISVSYVEGAPPGVAVAATHPRPLLSAELVAGSTVIGAASAVEHDAPPPRSGSFGLPLDLGVGIFGGSGGGIGTGVGIGVPLGGGGASAPPVDPNRYRARIPVSDTAAYRRDWERTNVRLIFGQTGDTVSVEVPAPAPR